MGEVALHSYRAWGLRGRAVGDFIFDAPFESSCKCTPSLFLCRVCSYQKIFCRKGIIQRSCLHHLAIVTIDLLTSFAKSYFFLEAIEVTITHRRHLPRSPLSPLTPLLRTPLLPTLTALLPVCTRNPCLMRSEVHDVLASATSSCLRNSPIVSPQLHEDWSSC